jgi:NarL family two-component system response regulator LiaR
MIEQTVSTASPTAAQPHLQNTIRVLVADDHAIVRKGICALLATEPGIEVVGEARDGNDAIAAAQKLQPDVILTSFAGDDKIFPAIRAGALGYLLKDSGPEELVQAIQQVHRGESSLHPTVARRLLRELSSPTEPRPDSECLTEREVEVLQLVAQGQSNRQVADLLTISEATVRTHVSNILSKLNLCSRTQAALYALREGLVSLNDCDPVGAS